MMKGARFRVYQSKPWYLGWFGSKVPNNNNNNNFSFTFSTENNNMLQLGTILNNAASALVLENFLQIFKMEDRYSSIFFGKSKNN